MALPFLPFLLGVATGAAATYIATNKSARQKMGQSAAQVADTVKSRVKATQTKLSGKTDNEAEKAIPATEEEKT